MPAEQIQYSEKYHDDLYEYRHVILPADIACRVPRSHLMSETEWRNLGVQQSTGWKHFMIHNPEPHVLLFRRSKEPSGPTVTSLLTNTTAIATYIANSNECMEVVRLVHCACCGLAKMVQ